MKYILLALALLVGCRKLDPVEVTEATEVTELVTEEVTEEESEIETEEETEYTGPYSVLSGLPIDKEERRAFGVMIDNQVDARPQAGLSKANLIYEYEVESEITRYLAIFSEEEVDKIGPIRSLRPYYIDTLLEHGAMVVRFGGSTQADGEVYDMGIDQIDGMSNGANIWRDSSTGKFAPHNAFSSSESIRSYMEAMGFDSPAERVFSLNEEAKDLEGETIDVLVVGIDFNPYERTSFEYRNDKNDYVRKINGETQVDEYYETDIKADNIVVLFKEYGYMENGIHRWVANTGSGEGLYITRSKGKKIHWSKEDRGAKTKLTYEDGGEVLLNPGKTWIEIVDLNKGVDLE